MKKILTLTLLVAICLMSLSLISCDKLDKENPSYDVTVDPNATTATDDVSTSDDGETEEATTDKVAAEGLWANATYRNDKTFGNGEKTVQVEVKAEDKSVTFTIKTNAETLADALVENNLVEGNVDQYGLYIKKVNGILADYNIDGSWWGVEKNGEMLMTGVSSTEIADGENYELVYSK